MMRPRSDEDFGARAMAALEKDLVIPKDLEARLVEAALGDRLADAMRALEADLVLPKELEARLYDAVAPEKKVKPRAPRRSGAMALVAAAFVLAVVVGFAFRAGERARPDGFAETAQASALRAEAERVAKVVSEADWKDGAAWTTNMALVESLRVNVEALPEAATAGKVLPTYEDAVRRAFLEAGRAALESSLERSTGEWSLEDRDNLKQYLLLNDPAHLGAQTAWQTVRLTATCAEAVAASSNVTIEEARAKVGLHVGTFVRLLERGLVAGLPPNERIVEHARTVLGRAEPRGYYRVFVAPLAEAPRDPKLPASPQNLAYPPVTLDAIVADEPRFSALVHSRNKKTWGMPYEVLGVYTKKARRAVLRSIEDASEGIAKDGWVVRDAEADRRVRDAIERVREDYDGLYVQEWVGFLRDIEVAHAESLKEALPLLRAAAAEGGPLVRVLRTVRDHTESARAADARSDSVSQRFDSIARFAEAEDGGIGAYGKRLSALADELEGGRASPREAATAFAQAEGDIRSLLRGVDEGTRELLLPLLVGPLEPPLR